VAKQKPSEEWFMEVFQLETKYKLHIYIYLKEETVINETTSAKN
jgi:hypothetical protein